MFRTFKGRLESIIDSELLQNGDAWISSEMSSTNDTFDLSQEKLTFSVDEIVFSEQQITKYNGNIRIDPFMITKLEDGTKYELNKYYKRAKVHYEVKINTISFKIHTNWWNTFILNVLHNRYWLFNEKKWFVTFTISLLGLILALIALLLKTC